MGSRAEEWAVEQRRAERTYENDNTREGRKERTWLNIGTDRREQRKKGQGQRRIDMSRLREGERGQDRCEAGQRTRMETQVQTLKQRVRKASRFYQLCDNIRGFSLSTTGRSLLLPVHTHACVLAPVKCIYVGLSYNRTIFLSCSCIDAFLSLFFRPAFLHALLPSCLHAFLPASGYSEPKQTEPSPGMNNIV